MEPVVDIRGLTRLFRRTLALDEVTLAVAKDGAIVMRPAPRKYQLDELVSRITPRNRHDETDWGAQVGKEAW